MTEEELQRQRVRRGYWMRVARKRAGLTLKTVAKDLGYAEGSASTVKLWEDGKRDPDVSQLAQLAAIYGVPVALLMTPRPTDEERLLALAGGERAARPDEETPPGRSGRARAG